MRKTILVGWAVIVAAVLNYGIVQKEKVIRNGSDMYLKLAPVDPRSLMQGDYMRLNYQVANDARSAGIEAKTKGRGYLVLKIAKNGVAEFERVFAGESLDSNEILIRYHAKHWRIRVVPDSFFFQEGHGDYYRNAKYGEFKVDKSGSCVLVGLTDENFKRLGPQL